MWNARTKDELMIEVWEKLDCESVGAVEIEAIEIALQGRYGKQAVDSPMIIARKLADEGAELRHSEIMGLYVERAENRPYDAAFRNILDLGDLSGTIRTIRDLENLRRKYLADNDQEGLRHVREFARAARDSTLETAQRPNLELSSKNLNTEIAEWITIWLRSPDIFEPWVSLRQNSEDFLNRFGAHLRDR